MQVILITLAAAFFSQSGFLIWKVVAGRMPDLPTRSFTAHVRHYLFSPLWLSGLMATAFGWLLLMKAIDLGEVSIVQPLSSVGDLFLVFVAIVFLGERLRGREWTGVGLTVIGAFVLGLQASVVVPTQVRWTYFVAFCVGVVAISVLLYLGRSRSAGLEVVAALAVGVAFGLGAVLTELMTAQLSLSGRSFESIDLFLNPVMPFVLLANFTGIAMLQLAFKFGRAAVVIPIVLSITNAVVMIGGASVFGESLAVGKLVGIALIVAGSTTLHRFSNG